MAIDPPSDIVLEVARAADPERAAAVARRLTNLGAAGVDPGADFAAALRETSPPKGAPRAPIVDASNMRARLADVGSIQNEKAKQARIQFEAVLLNSFVSEMLPKDMPATYGQGLAGEMWRSMLADQVSRKIASSGALGIGERLFRTHPLTAISPVGQAGVAAPAQMSANALSAPSAADYADGAFLFPGAKAL